MSLNFLNDNKISQVLNTLLLSNAFLYFKMASQISLKHCPELIFYNGMSILGLNVAILLILISINKSKRKIIDNSILF